MQGDSLNVKGRDSAEGRVPKGQDGRHAGVPCGGARRTENAKMEEQAHGGRLGRGMRSQKGSHISTGSSQTGEWMEGVLLPN